MPTCGSRNSSATRLQCARPATSTHGSSIATRTARPCPPPWTRRRAPRPTGTRSGPSRPPCARCCPPDPSPGAPGPSASADAVPSPPSVALGRIEDEPRSDPARSPIVELRQLEYFLAVVEGASCTRAATRLYIVQSSLSAALLALERELGTELFIGGGHGAELTDAGRAFLEPARAALQEADRARDAVAEVQGLLRGSVRIATVATPPTIDVCHTIRRFRDEHPDVGVHVVPDGAGRVNELVADGRVDFGITPLTQRPGPALCFEPLVSTPLVVACPPRHRLAGARDVDLRDLVDDPIIDLPRGWWARDLLDRMVEERGLHRRGRLEVTDWLRALPMVQRGVGVSSGPRAGIDTELFQGVGVATLAESPTWDLGIATRDTALRGAAGRAFLAAYLEQCREYRAPGPLRPCRWRAPGTTKAPPRTAGPRSCCSVMLLNRAAGRARRRSPSVAVGDREEVDQPGHLERAGDRPGGGDQPQGNVTGPRGLVGLDEDCQTGRAQELDPGQVDDELTGLLFELAVERGTEHRGGERVHLADDRDRHHAVLVGGGRKRDHVVEGCLRALGRHVGLPLGGQVGCGHGQWLLSAACRRRTA